MIPLQDKGEDEFEKFAKQAEKDNIAWHDKFEQRFGESRQLFEWVTLEDYFPTEKGWYILKCLLPSVYKVVLYNPDWDSVKRFEEATGYENKNLKWLKTIQSSLKEETDLHQQVIDHIRNYKLFDWDEALSDNEMSLLEDMFMSFNPLCPPGSIGFEEQKRHIEKLSSLTPKSIRDSEVADQIFKSHFVGREFTRDKILKMIAEGYNTGLSASLKPNKLSDGEIEKMAEDYSEENGERITKVHEYFTQDALKSGFIAGAQAIINKQK